MGFEDMQNSQPSSRSESAGSLRLFIAVPLPDEIRKQVAGLSANLQKGFQFTPNRPSWSDPETTHLTLVFIGSQPEALVEPIAQLLDDVAADFEQLRLEIKRLGVFPHWRNPKVLWAGVRDRTHQVEAMHTALERRLTRFGYTPEARDYHPHLTLARFKFLKGAQMVESVVNNHQGFKFGPFIAPELVLFKSVLHPSGAQHTPLHRAALKPSTRVPDLESDQDAEQE